ncbi:MAG: type III pantothenate kinase [Ruminococcus sp.]|nr:type III pantothenate kinase [Ruminococcus sp.]MBQ8906170.1 type III pantothenate kinase [Ruminococcus sp.]
MVLTVDVGNTNIVLSAYRDDARIFTSRMATQATKMEDEYAIMFADIMRLYECENECFEGAILSTVVPQLVTTLTRAITKVCNCRVIVVAAGIKTGLNIKLDDPGIVGADLVCGAVAAKSRYPMPCIIFDMGTATTISALGRDGAFLGGSILPGVRISLHALSQSTAQLPHIDPDSFRNCVIGTNTIDSMRSGVILGNASMMDGMIERYRSVLGEDATVVVTGGMAEMILPHCKTTGMFFDSDLLSDGLYMLYKMNTKS